MSPEREDSSNLPSDNGRYCSWVRDNLGAYDLWDDSLSQAEFGAIESHLHHCPPCASEYADIRRAREVIEMTLAGVDRDEWEREKRDFAAKILARLRDSGLFEAEEPTSATVVPLAAPQNQLYEPAEPRQDDTRQGPRRGKRLLVMAASLFLTFALPVLALVVVREFLPAPTASESGAESPGEGPTSSPQTPLMPRLGSDGPSVETVAPYIDDLNGGFDATEMLDADAETKLRAFELAALLPDTEEEYEAWTRKEYPHVMGLYDILTKVDEHDPNAAPLWDGVPVHIPDWGMRLYEDTPSDERPTGWRALLVYSGELFKFDWPTNTGDPNCKPTPTALERAAAVAGFSLDAAEKRSYNAPQVIETGDGHNVLTRMGGVTLAWVGPAHEVPEAYCAKVVEDVALTREALCYLGTSSSLVGNQQFTRLSRDAAMLLQELSLSRIPECEAHTRLSLFSSFLDSRGELLGTIGQMQP